MINPIDGSCMVYSGNPNRLSSSSAAKVQDQGEKKLAVVKDGKVPESQKSAVGTQMWGQFFGSIAKLPSKPGPGFSLFPPPSAKQKSDTCIELTSVDLKVLENGVVVQSSATNSSPPKNCLQNGTDEKTDAEVFDNKILCSTVKIGKGQELRTELVFYRPIDFGRDNVNIFLENDLDRKRIPVIVDEKSGKTDDSAANFLRGKLVPATESHTMTVDISLKSTQSPKEVNGDVDLKGVWHLHIITGYKNGEEVHEFDYFTDKILIDV